MNKTISSMGNRIEFDKKIEDKINAVYAGMTSHGSHSQHSSSR